MKETIEQAARAHIESNPNSNMSYPEWDGADVYDAFIAGAEWQSKQSPWISVEERLPEHDNGQSLCNVIIKFDDGSHYVVVNIDVEDMAKAGGATHWMEIPKV